MTLVLLFSMSATARPDISGMETPHAMHRTSLTTAAISGVTDKSGTVWYGAVLYCTVRYGTVRYCTVLYRTIRYGTILYASARFGMVRYGTVDRFEGQEKKNSILRAVRHCQRDANTSRVCTKQRAKKRQNGIVGLYRKLNLYRHGECVACQGGWYKREN